MSDNTSPVAALWSAYADIGPLAVYPNNPLVGIPTPDVTSSFCSVVRSLNDVSIAYPDASSGDNWGPSVYRCNECSEKHYDAPGNHFPSRHGSPDRCWCGAKMGVR